MKQIITMLLASASFTLHAQPKLLTQAIVSTKTTIVAPEADNNQPAGNFTSESGEQIRVMRFGGDGETKTTTWLKNNLVKTFMESETARTTTIRDNEKKLTTTIIEAMGRKTGFYATDEEQAAMRAQMDSMMRSRSEVSALFSNKPPTYETVYLDDAKKISGYSCKKALIIGTSNSGRKDTTVVWYSPDFKLQGIASTGGSAGGFGNFSQAAGLSGMDDINGFPMQYERPMRNGGKMTVQVTKLVTDKDVSDKEFEISKDIEIKPMKEMQSGGGPGFRMRITQ